MDITWDDYLGENWWGWQESSSTEVEPTFSPSTGMSTWSGYWEDVHFFSADFFGTHLAFQWYYSSDKITWSPILDATRATYKIASMMSTEVAGGQGYYKCVATNNKGTAYGIAQAICIMHPFSERYDNDTHNMGFYDRYDQRVNYECQSNGFYIGYADNQTPKYRDNVFAWAKGVTIYSSSGYSGYAAYYVGAYGASNCRLLLENSTIHLYNFYINFAGSDEVSSNNNSVEVKNSTILHSNGETVLGYGNYPYGGEQTASLTLSNGTVWKNGFNHIVFQGNASAGISVNCKFIVTGSGTAFLGDYGNTGLRYSRPIYVAMTTSSAGNLIDLLNNSLIRVGQGQSDGQQANGAIGVAYGTSSTQFAFRFGGGFLAYYGDCTHPEIDNTMHWSLKSEEDYYQILPTSVIQVRNSDGTWRAGVEGDFTVTYCATDAEGLAATGGLYDGLAGYTIITAGASIT